MNSCGNFNTFIPGNRWETSLFSAVCRKFSMTISSLIQFILKWTLVLLFLAKAIFSRFRGQSGCQSGHSITGQAWIEWITPMETRVAAAGEQQQQTESSVCHWLRWDGRDRNRFIYHVRTRLLLRREWKENEWSWEKRERERERERDGKDWLPG